MVSHHSGSIRLGLGPFFRARASRVSKVRIELMLGIGFRVRVSKSSRDT